MSGKEQQQRGRMVDRFIVIPFSSTCRSASSVDVAAQQQASRHANKQPQGGAAGNKAAGKQQQGEQPLSLVARLLRGFKNLSQIFAVYDEDEEDEEQEMVIGLPTDVKHVAHIGWDGSTSTTTSVRSWNRAPPPPPPPPSAAASTSSSSAAPPPALSVRQFEAAMAAQASAAGRHRHS